MKKKKKDIRYPNLQTILMVEEILKKNRSKAVKISQLKKMLPKQVMHQTLKIILDYLWQSKKIEFTPKGIRWSFDEKEVDKR